MIIVDTIKTPVDLRTLAMALQDILTEPVVRLESLLALIAVETGNGAKMNNFNVGNISASESYTGNARRPGWFTITDSSSASDIDLHARMLRGEAPSAFRAYDSLEQGIRDYVDLLQRSRYQHLWAVMAQGDDSSMVAELKASGYSPDYGPQHVATFTSLRKQIREAGYFGNTSSSGLKPLLVGGAILIGAGLALQAISDGKMPSTERLKALFGLG